MTLTERVLQLRETGLSFDQIAERLGITRSAVAGRIFRATKPERAKEYADENREWIKKRKADYYELNKEKYRSLSKNRYEQNRDKELIRRKEYYRANAELIKAKQRARYLSLKAAKHAEAAQ